MNKEPLGAAQSDTVKHSETRQLTQITGTWIALAAFVGGAVSAGMTHYAGTAKALKEEGIEPAARLRAFPTAVKALAISTALTGAIGAVALAGLKYGGLGAKDVADVASWRGAIQAGQYHRDLIKDAFQERIQRGAAQPPKRET
ncbi:g6206 [Coccomyxa viridis]|uniref:G6206 protein n=1 Tax=Coccomyxa viridis TaxID=1274662 RepID=A0ABP1FUT9_9CHLO